MQLAKLSGADVLVTDVLDGSLKSAKKLGAHAVVNTGTQDGRQRAMDFTNRCGVDVAYECARGASVPVTFPQAASFTRIGGKVVLVGGF